MTQGALWFAFRDERLLVLEGDEPRVPRASNLEDLGLEASFSQPVGHLDGSSCWAAELPDGVEAPEGSAFVDLRAIFAAVDEEFFAVAGRAKQVVGWRATHRFCGRCGGETGPVEGEMAMRCARCGMMHYPRVSPAVIVRVRPGESIEETIHREVREEVGIEVENLRYFGSQPWPFPNSLMIGFTADYAGGELAPQPGEIEDAGWYRADDLPQLPPKVSIARRMIEDFVSRPGG